MPYISQINKENISKLSEEEICILVQKILTPNIQDYYNEASFYKEKITAFRFDDYLKWNSCKNFCNDFNSIIKVIIFWAGETEEKWNIICKEINSISKENIFRDCFQEGILDVLKSSPRQLCEALIESDIIYKKTKNTIS